MKRLNILFLLLALGLASPAPAALPEGRCPALPRATDDDTADELREALASYFDQYRLKGFRPQLTIALDRYTVDDEKHTLDVYGNEGFASQTFTPDIVSTVYRDLKARLPQPYNTYRISVYGFGQEISTLIPNIYREQPDTCRLWGSIDYTGAPWVRNASRPFQITRGLNGRHLTVWASHGRYYNHSLAQWKWQRPFIYCTTEDLFTLSFVTPFLIPMLENAGAVVYTPRERDWQTEEIIVDNDGSRTGEYLENVDRELWQDTPAPGYAARKESYVSGENPFTDGTARQASAVRQAAKASQCQWTPRIVKPGRYAVYVSYATLPNSIPDARYTVRHRGVATHFVVNQKMGGSTWVYLGTFDFGAGQSRDNSVTLTNVSNFRGVVTADAVRFGGGMGNVVRGSTDDNAETSGLPRYLEGARYSTQMAGLPDSTYNTKDGFNDYADDINARSLALDYLGGGSPYMPDSVGRRVPFELSLAVHSDAGVAGDDHVIGTLAISTLQGSHGDSCFASGVSRLASADLAGLVQNTVCSDLSRQLGIEWTRRELYNRNYSETRIPEVPSAIIEMLSHQNFNDMKFGHDPTFKFLISRSIYKALLRFVASQHQTPCVVQPLPVSRFSAQLTDSKNITLRWTPATDSLEPSARPDGYLVYCRRDDGGFDNGTVVRQPAYTLPADDDVIYHFKVTAFNEGGESFPSEELSVMRASDARGEVLIVNGFDRLSAPAVVNSADSVGFVLDRDIGVAYMQTPEYSGRQLNFDPMAAGSSGANGLGYCGSELQGQMVGGNTFDYPACHGRAIKAAGRYSFSSCSGSALTSGHVSTAHYNIVDLILGLQKDDGESSLLKYKTYTPAMQKALESYLNGGGRLFVSGSYIASDNAGQSDSHFTRHVLHYGHTGHVAHDSDSVVTGATMNLTITRTISPGRYAVQQPDRIAPTTDAYTAFVYADGSSAGIAYDGHDYKVLALGFPFESIVTEQKRNEMMDAVLQLLSR